MRPVSSSSNLYSMNVVDDFLNYMWSLPLISKGDAASELQKWHCTIENQSGLKLKVLVTDNGELLLKSISDWCSQFRIIHYRMAPYTSAQNGHAERMHQTLLDKACVMHLSCNAPAFLWDEFCATLAYLTNLTSSSTLQNQTPFKLWFSKWPSLNHLRKIGCHAFSLIQTSNPKVFARS